MHMPKVPLQPCCYYWQCMSSCRKHSHRGFPLSKLFLEESYESNHAYKSKLSAVTGISTEKTERSRDVRFFYLPIRKSEGVSGRWNYFHRNMMSLLCSVFSGIPRAELIASQRCHLWRSYSCQYPYLPDKVSSADHRLPTLVEYRKLPFSIGTGVFAGLYPRDRHSLEAGVPGDKLLR